MKEEEALQLYKDYMVHQKAMSKHSIDAYMRDINLFLSYAHNENETLFSCSTTLIRNFMTEERSRGIAKSSLKRRIVALRRFYGFLLDKEIIYQNPFINILAPKTDKKLPDFLYDSEMKSLLSKIKDMDDEYSLRNQAIIELLFASGLRVSELCNLQLADIHIKQRFLRVIGKGNKERVVPFSSSAQQALENYINVLRSQLILKKDSQSGSSVFLNEFGNPLTPRGVQYILHELDRKYNLGLALHPHKFRHTFATTMLSRGADLRTIQEILGHESLSTTQIYTHITSAKMKEDYNKYFPRNRKNKK